MSDINRLARLGAAKPSTVTAIPFPCKFICRVHGPTNDFHELEGIRGCNVCSKLSAIAAMRINAYAQ